MFINALYNSHVCAVLVSEENDDPILLPPDIAGKFCVAFDPLDGSSNIDCNVSTGTIFGVWKKQENSGPPCADDILKPGREMICAGYCAYGSATELVLTYHKGVQRFTLDPSLGEFILTGNNLKLPDICKTIYSVNEGNTLTWDKNMQRCVEGFRLGTNTNSSEESSSSSSSGSSKPYTARYVGSMVADIHRTLLYGGVYLYPADAKKGNGKLRILYEGFPMAMIIEHAGGMASTGAFRGSIGPILDLVPQSIHDKCPVIIGCNRDVSRCLSYYK